MELRDLAERFSEPINVKDYGAAGDGATDDTLAFQQAIAACVARTSHPDIFVPAGDYVISNELSFDGFSTPFAIRGEQHLSRIFYTSFGCTKSVIKGSSVRNAWATIDGLYFAPVNDEHHDLMKDPIVIYLPVDSRSQLRRITTSGGGNTQIWCNNSFNSSWSNINLYMGGSQEVWKTVPKSVVVASASGTSVTVSASIFASGDAGKELILGVPIGGLMSSIRCRIVSVTSGTTVVIDKTYPAQDIDSTRRARVSFCPVTCSATAGSATVVLEKAWLTASDVGRRVYLLDVGAASYDALLMTTVTAVSGTSVTLADAPQQTKSAIPFIITPTVFLGGLDSMERTNDVVISDLRIEGFRGPGVIFKTANNVRLGNLKVHGRSWGSSDGTYDDFGMSSQSIIASSATVNLSQVDHEFCSGRIGGGVFEVQGYHPKFSVDTLTIGSACTGEYLGRLRAYDPMGVGMVFGTVTSGTGWPDYLKGFVNTASLAWQRSVFQYGPWIRGGDSLVALGTTSGGTFRSGRVVSIDAGETVSFPAPSDVGQIIISTAGGSDYTAASVSGSVLYVAASGQCVRMYGGNRLLVPETAGADISDSAVASAVMETAGVGRALLVSFLPSSGEIQIRNELVSSGTKDNFHITLLG